ncbi:hypothetical protein BpHYR1_005337 [Brachionus plicatilis]|uniref:Uncharacterized protein n=1 Tax=Brachionus plicatilis TaxID=10195 RepID=A0A3M7Q206_BRAPC|nr:hypothetical protein BpHYR1_005337 [Brachionus plicatilis]
MSIDETNDYETVCASMSSITSFKETSTSIHKIYECLKPGFVLLFCYSLFNHQLANEFSKIKNCIMHELMKAYRWMVGRQFSETAI